MKTEQIKIRWYFEDDDISYEDAEVIFIDDNTILYLDDDSGLVLEKIARTSKGEVVFVEEIAHLNSYDETIKKLNMKDIANLSAIGLFSLIAELAGGNHK